VVRRERAEQRHAMLRATLSEAQTALRDELAAAEAQLSPPQGTDADSQRTIPTYLRGARLLYVGGRPGHIPRIRAFVEEAQAEFLHYDGGVEERKGLLAGIVSRADAILFPVERISVVMGGASGDIHSDDPDGFAPILHQWGLHDTDRHLTIGRNGEAFHALVGDAARRVAADLLRCGV
jgi:hypothetical protein